MRVLHVIDSLAPGGAEHQLLRLVGATCDRCDHVVVQLGGSRALAPELMKHAPVTDLRLDGRLRAARAVPPLRRVLDRQAPDVLQSWLFHAHVAARLATLPRRRPRLVAAVQSPDYEPEARAAGGWPRSSVEAQRIVDAVTLRLSRSTLVGCSAYVAESSHRRLHAPRGCVEHIPNVVDAGQLARDAAGGAHVRRELGLGDEAFLFVNVGRLDGQKGQGDLLEAFARIAPRAPGAHLAIAGHGPLERALAARAAVSASGARVHLLGLRRDVPAVLAAANAFVLPSRFEGLPVALLEAMAMGVPVAAYGIAPIREVTEDGRSALVVAPGDTAALAAAMERLLADPALRRQLAEAGGHRVREAYSFDAVAGRWLGLWRRLAEDG